MKTIRSVKVYDRNWKYNNEAHREFKMSKNVKE